MWTIGRVLVVALLVAGLVTPVGTVGAASATAAASGAPADDTVDLSHVVSHDPAGPTIEVRLTVRMPDRVVELETRLPPGVEVTGTDGFDRTDGSYEWDGETTAPTIDYEVPADDDRVLLTEAYARVGRADFVAAVSYRYRSPEVGVERHVEVDGTGAVYGYEVAMWEDAVTRRSDDGTTITVVTPPSTGDFSVEPNESRQRAVADRLVAIDEFFGFDRTDDRIVVFLRPSDSVGFEGPVAGRANTAGTILLEADSATDRNLLAHEFVHTQQDFVAAAETDWFVEGSADYLAYYYEYNTGRIDFETFRDRLNVRDDPEYRDVNLRNLTNASETADYRKGRHVAAGLDAWIRERSDGEARLADVLVARRRPDVRRRECGLDAGVRRHRRHGVRLDGRVLVRRGDRALLTAGAPGEPVAVRPRRRRTGDTDTDTDAVGLSDAIGHRLPDADGERNAVANGRAGRVGDDTEADADTDTRTARLHRGRVARGRSAARGIGPSLTTELHRVIGGEGRAQRTPISSSRSGR